MVVSQGRQHTTMECECVEDTLLNTDPKDITKELPVQTLTDVLDDLKSEKALFRTVLTSFLRRFDLSKAAGRVGVWIFVEDFAVLDLV